MGLGLIVLAGAGIAQGLCIGSAYLILKRKWAEEAYNRRKHELALSLEKSSKLLCMVDISLLEQFFANIEESQWENFQEAFHTMDMFLLKGSLGIAKNSTKQVLKHHDTLDDLADNITSGRRSLVSATGRSPLVDDSRPCGDFDPVIVGCGVSARQELKEQEELEEQDPAEADEFFKALGMLGVQDVEVVRQMLQEKPALATMSNPHGAPAFVIAAMETTTPGHEEKAKTIMGMLIAARADPWERASSGRNALDYATINENRSLCEFLRHECGLDGNAAVYAPQFLPPPGTVSS